MRKLNGAKVCYGMSLILFAMFVINTIIDYGRYNSTLNSAPFYMWILVNAICFVVPAIIALMLGLVIRMKKQHD